MNKRYYNVASTPFPSQAQAMPETAGETPHQPEGWMGDGTLIPSRIYPGAVFGLALTGGVFVTLAIFGAGLAVMYFSHDWSEFGAMVVLALLVGMIAGSGAGIWWTLNLASLQGLMAPRVVTVTETIISEQPPVERLVHMPGDVLAIQARRIIDMHYLDGSEATRQECESAGIVQENWNLLNQALQACGLKAPRGWVAGLSYEQAVVAWRIGVRILDDGAVWVSEGGQSKRLN
jgi:hypothetical protein